MSDLFYEIAIWVPATMIVWGLMWYNARERGVIRTGAAFKANDIYTWPMLLVLTIAAVFGLLFAGVKVAINLGSWGTVAIAVAVSVATWLLPRFWARVARPGSASSHPGGNNARVDDK